MHRGIGKIAEAALIDRTTVQVRFSEVDSMRIVWHGEYIRYFEDGRESFGRRYGLSYMNLYEAGYKVPIVEINCEYKSPLMVDDRAIVETRFINTDSAKIVFEYSVFREVNNTLVATGRSVQVFLDNEDQLVLSNPDIYLEWKKRWKIIE
ncbi:MAG TPA: acyl-CoA thioesterase [Paludibacteraceae bacterium]|jgi:acyl-CoA thioester hydrolase|nr:acyl-CoA thioesterase [Paludibacteraceae bacterium]HOU67805.1 acyl-CoA thioesterase [Paludibacteraceae bacterium]HPH62102.1 acyl-CoA thioesterase [Paludibacteraceae bacterium]HQF49356.1 acyl-CoA thioesterase [Paludibacteraceae bacterium]HQJ90386.1 acyl-CoA thioesterase [Paludibacteraceae bacterium]